jgi:hypothetical protein
MSRSWERKVRKNSTVINKQRKKMGLESLTSPGAKIDRFRGRNYIWPAFLILFTLFYAYMVTIPTEDPNAINAWESPMFWVTIVSYVLLATLFYFRRPYLNVAKDYIGTRKMTGDKMLQPSGIKQIVVSPGYIVIEQVKGASWVFSRMLNRYPIDQMAARLQEFAQANNVKFEMKTK